MTKDEFLQQWDGMSSQQRNLLVAVRVFGWTAWEETRGEYKYIVFQRPGDREPYKKYQKWESQMQRYRLIDIPEIDPMKHIVCGLKDYSTDISAAYEMESKIIGNNPFLYSRRLAEVIFNVTFSETEEVTFAEDFIHHLIHATPLQRCQAALLTTLED